MEISCLVGSPFVPGGWRYQEIEPDEVGIVADIGVGL